ncbi:hypothetical protein BT67DRAFT_156395 [Trichocladium antarcticum]|uniref:Uncharacterized protein n=1 Tax=Trichocladium antarcticum TaxID=1450529 RepID=A0AAN6UEG8_9PEZI|nr:hypothetical protein BT67DRAFT_156395 [Trichocladium antarcticum]
MCRRIGMAPPSTIHGRPASHLWRSRGRLLVTAADPANGGGRCITWLYAAFPGKKRVEGGVVSRSRHAQCRSEAKDGSGDRSGEMARRVSIPCGSTGLGLQCTCEREGTRPRQIVVCIIIRHAEKRFWASHSCNGERKGRLPCRHVLGPYRYTGHAHVQCVCICMYRGDLLSAHHPEQQATPPPQRSARGVALLGELVGMADLWEREKGKDAMRRIGVCPWAHGKDRYRGVMNGQFMQDTSAAVRHGCIHLNPAGYTHCRGMYKAVCVFTMVDG